VLAELFVRHAEELCVFLRNRRGRNDAEDLVQVSFARLIENKREQMVGNPRAWLYSTSANLAADAYDYQRVRSGLHVEWAAAEQVEDACADPARINIARQQLQRVLAALMTLPESCRHAFNPQGQRLLADTVPISDLTAWREGALVFRDAPLTRVLTEFARYHPVHLQLDRKLADYRLSGRFVSRDLNGVLKFLEQAYPIRVERLEQDRIRLQLRG